MVTVSCQPVIGKRLYKPPRWGKFTKYLFAAIQTDRAPRPQHRPVFNAAASKASWEDFQIALLKLNSPAGTQGTWGELAIVRGACGVAVLVTEGRELRFPAGSTKINSWHTGPGPVLVGSEPFLLSPTQPCGHQACPTHEVTDLILCCPNRPTVTESLGSSASVLTRLPWEEKCLAVVSH